MQKGRQEIPAKARELAESGQKIEAIKITREQTGLGLKEAKEAIEAYLRHPGGRMSSIRPNRSRAKGLPRQAITALENGQFIEAVKRTREETGLGLKAAKQTVEHFLEQNQGIQTRFKAASSAEFKRVAGKYLTILSVVSLAVLGYFCFFVLR